MHKYPPDKKIGTVLSVHHGRSAKAALKEAWALEEALIDAGYELYFPGKRKKLKDAPCSATLRDFKSTIAYINSRREKLDGVFLFLMYLVHLHVL